MVLGNLVQFNKEAVKDVDSFQNYEVKPPKFSLANSNPIFNGQIWGTLKTNKGTSSIQLIIKSSSSID